MRGSDVQLAIWLLGFSLLEHIDYNSFVLPL